MYIEYIVIKMEMYLMCNSVAYKQIQCNSSNKI